MESLSGVLLCPWMGEEKSCRGTTILTHPGMVRNPSYMPYVSQTTLRSIILICGTNLIKSAVLYCLADAPCHFTKGACPESFSYTMA